VLVALGAAHVVALVGYGVVIAGRARRGLPTRPAWFALAQAFAVTAFGYFVIGPFEPLYPAAVTYEQQILAVAVVVGTVHGVQYLGVIAAVSRRRYAGDAAGTVAARLGRAPRLAYGLCVAASLAYLALNAARGEGPWLAWFAPATLGAKLFLALYWGLFLHHFYLDQKIWHPRVDAELRQELGIA
jgi:hypothetical protein